MKRKQMAMMTVLLGGITLLHAGDVVRLYSDENVKTLENAIRSIEPPVSWPPNKWYVRAIPEFVASNDIPKDVYVATFEKVAEERIALYSSATNRSSKSAFSVGAALSLNVMGDMGELGFLPFLAKHSESPVSLVQTRAAVAYVKIAGLDATPFVHKILSGSREKYDFNCKYLATKEFFEKIAKAESEKAPQEKIDDAYKMLIEQAQTLAAGDGGWELDDMLCKKLPEYSTSHQRNRVIQQHQKSTNEITRTHFTQEMSKLSKIPKAERTDLSKRFPSLAEVKLEDEQQTEAPSPAENK